MTPNDRVRVTFEATADQFGQLFVRSDKHDGQIQLDHRTLPFATIEVLDEPKPAMTDEELDRARASQAISDAREYENIPEMCARAARLAREGWLPPAPIDPAVLACRELLSEMFVTDQYVNGEADTSSHMKAALAAYNAGRDAR
jgi:hypothetical protein